MRRLTSLLAKEEVAALSSVVNQPQFVLARLRALAQSSFSTGVTEKEREIMLKSAATLGDCMSSCERIFNTPIPLAYSRHTSRFLVLYVSTLPLALVHALGWATVPVRPGDSHVAPAPSPALAATPALNWRLAERGASRVRARVCCR